MHGVILRPQSPEEQARYFTQPVPRLTHEGSSEADSKEAERSGGAVSVALRWQKGTLLVSQSPGGDSCFNCENEEELYQVRA